jgi:hypothetical protein
MKTKKNSKHTSAFSRQIDEQCHRISFREIKILWTILRDASRLDFVRARFMQDALHFSEVMDFLKGLGVVRVTGGQALRRESLGKTDDEMKSGFVQRLFNRTTPYQLHAHEFVGHFKSGDGSFEIVMDSEKRRHFGGVRNLLLDLEFLEQDADRPRYWISPQHLADFLEAKSKSPTSPIELQKILRAREKLGREAELEVLKFEAARLRNRPGLARRIKHVAAENVGAGYDILSFTESATSAGFSDRLIEVKAVSPVDFKFFWSRNEIEAARFHGQNYFLYLVPAFKNGFDMQKLKIIQNPFKQVYLVRKSWRRQDELVSLWLNDSRQA